MLSIETRDAWTWTLPVTVGGNTANFANSAQSAVGALQALVAWANAAGRPWAGAITFSWTWARDSGGGAVVTLKATAAFSITNATAATLQLPAVAGATQAVGTGAAVGTWAPTSGIRASQWRQWTDEAGDAGGAGSVRGKLPGTSDYRPLVGAVGVAQDAARLTYIEARASTPRRAWVWRRLTGDWALVALGPVQRTTTDAVQFAFSAEVAG